jgi:hypothetical protein
MALLRCCCRQTLQRKSGRWFQHAPAARQREEMDVDERPPTEAELEMWTQFLDGVDGD